MTSLRPSLKEFRRLTEDGNLIPVVTELISDVETPVGAFAKIGPGGFSFFFESAERNEESGRFSFIGIDPLLVISSRGSELTIWEKTAGITKCAVANPLEQLQRVLAEFRFLSRNDIPHFQGGAVGFVGYDVVRFFEPKTTIHPRDDLGLPEMVFMIAGTLIVFDHRFRMIRLIVSADLRKQKADAAYEEAAKEIERVLAQLSTPSPLKPIGAGSAPAVSSLTSNVDDFEQMVDRAKTYISDGDIFQVVLSQRFQSEFSADPLELYSHVMHIVSHIQAQLRDGLNAFDAFRATFPAGTVSGAPKIRAMQIISELEKSRRGFYAGVVGWFGFDGNCDSCIALRSVVLKDGKAFVQAGAGIVADSEPAREREATERKAMAVLAAIEQAKCCC